MDTVECTANIAYKRTTFQNKKPGDALFLSTLLFFIALMFSELKNLISNLMVATYSRIPKFVLPILHYPTYISKIKFISNK